MKTPEQNKKDLLLKEVNKIMEKHQKLNSNLRKRLIKMIDTLTGILKDVEENKEDTERLFRSYKVVPKECLEEETIKTFIKLIKNSMKKYEKIEKKLED